MIDKKPITDFSDLLTNIGMNPKEVQMIRHTASVQEGMNETYYWLWKENPKKFDEENAWQKKDQFKDRKYLVVFVVTPTKETLFTRFYKINELTEKISEDRCGARSLRRSCGTRFMAGKFYFEGRIYQCFQRS